MMIPVNQDIDSYKTRATQMKRLHASRVKGIRAKQGNADIGRINFIAFTVTMWYD